mmetsp:Transcript_12076/g.21057  ORF Transcript_12076/g.21057 Transcript_12076/m.21057 type:complete len:156 (-) Transcript_12076:839-1306(-)
MHGKMTVTNESMLHIRLPLIDWTASSLLDPSSPAAAGLAGRRRTDLREDCELLRSLAANAQGGRLLACDGVSQDGEDDVSATHPPTSPGTGALRASLARWRNPRARAHACCLAIDPWEAPADRPCSSPSMWTPFHLVSLPRYEPPPIYLNEMLCG